MQKLIDIDFKQNTKLFFFNHHSLIIKKQNSQDTRQV
jgi:hypothetical protein